jgi:hypothetical protein
MVMFSVLGMLSTLFMPSFCMGISHFRSMF